MEEIKAYHRQMPDQFASLCDLLASQITEGLPEAQAKIWHRHPVWFLEGNPTVGYSLQKPGIRLMFWSGADFDEPALVVLGKNFKDASIFYNAVSEVNPADLQRWLMKSRQVKWDYQNIIRNRGLVRLP